MAKGTDHLARGYETENTGGVLTGLLAEEDAFDRRALWRLGSWGAAAVGAIIVAVTASQSSLVLRRDEVAAADLARQSQQIQLVARESQNETRRLAAAIDTLGGDRDRLYSRVTVLEQGLESVTGAIAKQNVAAAPPPAASAASVTTEPPSSAQNPSPAPAVAPVASTQSKSAEKSAEKPPTDTTPAQGAATVASVEKATAVAPAGTPPPLMASKSMMAPPDAAAGKLIEPEKPAPAAAPAPEAVASVSSEETDAPQAAPPPKVAVLRTEFGVDVGGANSVGGLRALWRGLLKSKSNAALATLRPIIVIREGSTGLGMQLRLVAGPLSDAAAAAKICAGLIENERPCETTVFDGQRLAMKADEQPAAAKPGNGKPTSHRRSSSNRVDNDDPSKKPESSTLSSYFGKR